MRWIHMSIVVLFATTMLIFGLQNREIITMDFLGFSVRAPHALMAIVFYVLGAFTGGNLFALLRNSVAGAKVSNA